MTAPHCLLRRVSRQTPVLHLCRYSLFMIITWLIRGNYMLKKNKLSCVVAVVVQLSSVGILFFLRFLRYLRDNKKGFSGFLSELPAEEGEEPEAEGIAEGDACEGEQEVHPVRCCQRWLSENHCRMRCRMLVTM